jgi:acyl-CoA synthetase (AMP-forming)/AMP-acid ligase II
MPGWSFARVWSEVAAAVPERDALVCGERRVTWGAFADRAQRLASHLATAGVEPGDKVALDMTNRPEYLEAFFAALLLGAVPVNVNYRYVGDEVRYVLDNSDARAVVHDPARRLPASGRLRSACSRPGSSTRRRSRRHRPTARGQRGRPTATTSSSSTPGAPPACRRA